MQTAVIDIETTGLGAVGSGILLCVCIRPIATARTRTFRIDEPELEKDETAGFLAREETALLQATADELDKYDLLVGHNIDRFDLPFLRTRCVQAGVRFRKQPFTYDTFRAFRRARLLTMPNGFGKPSAGMDMVADLLGCDGEKTKIYPTEWWLSVWGDRLRRIEAMNNIVEHCKHDVRMNANIYPALLELDTRAIIRRHL